MNDTQSPIAVVEEFCAAWALGEADALARFFANDAIYHNMPIDPIVGVDNITTFIASFAGGAQSIEFKVHHIVAQGNVVMTERTDVFTYPHAVIELPVMGTFEIRDGKIAAWRDYFDLNQYMSQLSGS
jgi:limonene-1,2-epoxide hydrolase